MDRFIVTYEFDREFSPFDLKSNMDRFIGLVFTAVYLGI